MIDIVKVEMSNFKTPSLKEATSSGRRDRAMLTKEVLMFRVLGSVVVAAGLLALGVLGSGPARADSANMPEVVVKAYGPDIAVPLEMPEVLVEADGPSQVVGEVKVTAKGPQLVVDEVRVSAKRPAGFGPLARNAGQSYRARSI